MLHLRILSSSTLALIAASGLALGASCSRDETGPHAGTALFASPPTNPIALSADQRLLFVANAVGASVSVFDVHKPTRPRLLAEIPVGLDPVGVAVRPKVDPTDRREDELVFVTNYISDSISVISRKRLDVVQTLQEIDPATGVTRTDEPTGIAFYGPHRAFVTLDQTNEVLVLEDVDGAGNATLSALRLPIAAQAPRALAIARDRLYVAAFESGNQTELASCGPDDPRGLLEGDPVDEGCEFHLELIEGFTSDGLAINLDLGVVFDFAAVDPNIGGRVIRDTDRPDRDLFVFDLAAPGLDSDPARPGVQPLEVVTGVGTLLYGVAAGAEGRLYVTNTEARNHLDGLRALENRMFENRISVLDCAAGCGAPRHVDLDASAGREANVPTPYGVAASADGKTLVVTGAGSDGLAPGSDGTPPSQPELYGLVTLDAEGNVLGGVRVGAIPQGVALRSHPRTGAAEYAFVLNTVDASIDVVDVREPTAPVVAVAGLGVGRDPTPPPVKAGRTHFMSARTSTSGTFSCESCHPNGNMDQILWTINAVEHPDDGPPYVAEAPEPRTTMPVRGLRDTLPLHWEGILSDPFPGTGAGGHEGPSPGCAPGPEHEVACIRDLVDASLAGVMCDPAGGCAPGPSGRPGALTGAERDELASFLAAVPYPPSPRRRPSDALSAQALLGVQDFFTNEDQKGINDGVGQLVNFAPATCADNPLGCHSLPLTVSTNSAVVGGFDVPSIRGMVDRHVLFSNGIVSSEEALVFAQACADGFLPPARLFEVLGFTFEISGDPCQLRSPLIEALLFPLFELDGPSGPEVCGDTPGCIYDPDVGVTERGAFLASFEFIFSLVYGVRGHRIWEYQEEVSVGLPGLTGRQVSLTPEGADDEGVVAAMDELEAAAAAGKVAALARNQRLGTFRYDREDGLWWSTRRRGLARGVPETAPGRGLPFVGHRGLTGAELRAVARETAEVITLTAELPSGISIGGADRQPLLDIDPDDRAAEVGGDAPTLPRPSVSARASFRLGAWYVDAEAAVLVNGAVCDGCGFTPARAETGDEAIDVTVPAGTFRVGMNVLQVLNPEGWASNELPIFAEP